MARMAYYTNESFYDQASGLYSVAVVEEHVAGWTPHRQFRDLADAIAFADDGNESRFHLSREEVVAIVASSIGQQIAVRSRVRDEDAVDAIAHAMAMGEWDTDLLNRIADIVTSTGRTITTTEACPRCAGTPGDDGTCATCTPESSVVLPTEQALRNTWLQR